MKATLANYRQSPRKVRRVADLIKGKSVPSAIASLSFLDKRSALPIKKLIASAVANAKNTFQMEEGALMVKSIRVDSGKVLKRSMPRARGSAFPIKKRVSLIVVELAALPPKKEKKARPAKASVTTK